MSRKLALGFGLVAIATVLPAHALPAPPPCCACVNETSGPTLALFCISPANEDEAIEASQRCESEFGANFLCLFPAQETGGVTQACVELLREASEITCPTTPGAPVLGGTALAGLAAVLSLLGVLTLRRRAAMRAR